MEPVSAMIPDLEWSEEHLWTSEDEEISAELEDWWESEEFAVEKEMAYDHYLNSFLRQRPHGEFSEYEDHLFED